MTAMERCEKCGIIPVVVIEDAKDAVATAKALLAGGIDVMEVTMRTAAAIDVIKEVSAKVPEMCSHWSNARNASRRGQTSSSRRALTTRQ